MGVIGSIVIANRALMLLGEPNIVSIADDNKAARACTSEYDNTRRAALRSHIWQFAKKRATLANALTVTGAANNGSGLIRLTVASTTSLTAAIPKVTVATVGGVPAATGTWSYTVVDATHIDLVLSAFAGTHTSGGTVQPAPLFGYSAMYALPSDNLRVLQINDFWFYGPSFTHYRTANEAAYTLDQGYVLTNQQTSIDLLYVFDNAVTTTYDDLFVDVLSRRLALDIAYAIPDSSTKKKSIEDGYRVTISEAISIKSIEQPPSPLPDNSWILSRR